MRFKVISATRWTPLGLIPTFVRDDSVCMGDGVLGGAKSGPRETGDEGTLVSFCAALASVESCSLMVASYATLTIMPSAQRSKSLGTSPAIFEFFPQWALWLDRTTFSGPFSADDLRNDCTADLQDGCNAYHSRRDL